MVDLKEENVATISVDNDKPPRIPERKAKLVVNKCCFCVPLKTGSLILAYLFLVGNVAAALLSIFSIINFAMFLVQVYRETLLIKLLVINTASLVLEMVALSFNILLLVGLHKERRNYVGIFVIFQLVNIVLNVLKHILIISLGYVSGIIIAIPLISDVLNIYFLLVMRSQYVKMGEAINKLPGQVYRDGRVEIMP